MGLLLIAYVIVDFSFNQPKPEAHRFSVQDLVDNTPMLLKQGPLLVVVAHYDQSMLDALNPAKGRLESISQSFRQQTRRVDKNGYFVALGYGTKSNCPLQLVGEYFKESCSDARYDRLGRALESQGYADLTIPQYTFNHDYSSLTIE